MAKTKDSNGFWEIKHNPISKVGVFPYMGRNISDDCEPNKVYYVYRPASTLAQSVDTWDNPPKPFINDHEMLGEGFSKVDDRPVQGVIHNPVFEADTLFADISVYSEALKDKIANGKKELSLGYFCKYRKEKGVYKGQAYDYVQEDMVGNHIALVDNGRCGSDVKVFDSKCTMDSLDLDNDKLEELKKNQDSANIETTEEKGSDMKEENKEEILVKDEEEKQEEIVKDEDIKEEEEVVAKDKCGKDEDVEEEEKETKDEDDVMSMLKMILEEVRSIKGKAIADEEEKEEKTEAEDEEEAESKSDEEKAEDEEEEEKKAEDNADVVVTFAKDSKDTPKSMTEDYGLRKYLGLI